MQYISSCTEVCSSKLDLFTPLYYLVDVCVTLVFPSNIYFSLLYILFQPGLVIITQLLSCGFLQVGNVALYIFGFDLKTSEKFGC